MQIGIVLGIISLTSFVGVIAGVTATGVLFLSQETKTEIPVENYLCKRNVLKS